MQEFAAWMAHAAIREGEVSAMWQREHCDRRVTNQF